MKIKRTVNGQEYEFALQPMEMRKAYEELKREYLEDDIMSTIANKCAEAFPVEICGDVYGEDIIIDDDVKEKNLELIGRSADQAEKGLSNNDCYWDCYWMSLGYGVEGAFMGSAPDNSYWVEGGPDDTFVVRQGDEKILEVKREDGENKFYVYNLAFVLEHGDEIRQTVEELMAKDPVDEEPCEEADKVESCDVPCKRWVIKKRDIRKVKKAKCCVKNKEDKYGM